MMKCPCEQCISFAICVSSKSVTQLLDKCELIFDYIKDWNTTVKSIEVLKPRWYVKNPRDLSIQAERLLGTVIAGRDVSE